MTWMFSAVSAVQYQTDGQRAVPVRTGAEAGVGLPWLPQGQSQAHTTHQGQGLPARPGLRRHAAV